MSVDEVASAARRVDELAALLRDFQVVRDGVPSLSRPAGVVGAVGSWTGAAADRLHREELAPLAASLVGSLQRTEQVLLDELAHARRVHERAQAQAGDA